MLEPTHLHPPLSAFPFALLTVVVLLEIGRMLGLIKNGEGVVRVNLLIASLASIATFFSGYYSGSQSSVTFKVDESALTSHIAAGRIVLLSLFPCLACYFITQMNPVNPKPFRVLYLLFLFVAYSAVLVSGYLGGELVFQHGAGVRAVIPGERE